MKLRNLALGLFFPWCLTACFSGHDKMLPNAVGAEGELMVVVDEELWRNHPIGDSLRDFLQQPYPGLPQIEPLFRLSRVEPTNFRGSIRRHQAVLFVVAGPQHPSPNPTLQFAHDPFAEGQLVVRLSANHPNEWLAAFQNRKMAIVDSFQTMDRQRKIKSLAVAPAQAAIDSVAAYMPIRIPLPEGFQAIALQKQKAIAHYQAERVEDGQKLYLSKSILAARMPYPGPEVFEEDSLIQTLDRLTSSSFFGENEGSWLVVEHREPPDFTYVNWDGRYAMAVRGLWRMSNEYKGGPFLAYLVVDEPSQTLWVFHGHMFGPGLDKRAHMIEMEAILRGIRF